MRVQHLAKAADLHARIGIVLRVEVFRLPEAVHGNGVGFQVRAAACAALVDQESQQPSHDGRPGKSR